MEWTEGNVKPEYDQGALIYWHTRGLHSGRYMVARWDGAHWRIPEFGTVGISPDDVPWYAEITAPPIQD